jgi:endo-1,4-beta-xylanase
MKFNNAFIISALVATANAYELLKDYSKGFRIGAATNTIHYNNANYVNAMKAFNYMVAENACKFVSIQGTKGKFNFNDCDAHLNKAKQLGMDFRGHALIWHSMAPKWLENEDSNSMKNSIVNHITNVLKHYEGQIDTWDVVNEAIDDSSNGNGWKMRNSFLYQKVPNFIDLSFQTARKVSPKTKLFYNDYNTEGIWGKSESVYQFIADLKKRNIPIDGVGLQYHVSVQHQPQFNKINDLIGRYCKLGVEVHITELDVSCVESCYAGDVEKKQSDVFTNALKACLGNSCCTGFLVWGIGDPDSWLGSDKKGLLFNSNYQPKSQYTAVLNVLKTTTAASLGKNGGNTGGNTGSNNGGNNNSSTTVDISKSAVKLQDGWYTIKNTGSGKYLHVESAGNSENVVISSNASKWKLTNTNDGYITLTSSVGNYMLDVAGGEDKNGVNLQIYSAYSGDAQKFVILKTSNNKVYTIGSKVSNGGKVIDVEKRGTTDGSNVIQYALNGASNQTWTFESTSAPSTNSQGNQNSQSNQSSQSKPENPSQSASCWSASLGYPCCKSCSVYYSDNDGKWGIENDNWCGILSSCTGSNASCVGAQGYPCCQNTCTVYSTDADGKWGIENNDWCLINKSKC